MQDDHYVSDEEAEQNFERDLERWESEPFYMNADYEKYCANPTDAGARLLWLKYTKLGESVPDDILTRVFNFIRDVAENRNSEVIRCEMPDPVLSLIHLVLSREEDNLEKFWNVLHDPSKTISLMTVHFDSHLLDEARKTFPTRRKLKNKDMYEFAAKVLNLDEINYESSLNDIVKDRYATFKKNL